MTNPTLTEKDVAEIAGRTLESLTRLERAWLRRHYCGWCEASLVGQSCYAMTGMHELPVIEGVRDEPEMIDLGESCDMDCQRAKALAHYRPRSPLISTPNMPKGDRA